MNWRKRLGAAPEIYSESEYPPQYTQNSQKGGDDTPKVSFEDIEDKKSSSKFETSEPPFEDIEDNISGLRIEKMEICLHSRHCGYLRSHPPDRPCCHVTGRPIFDLVACPLNKWTMAGDAHSEALGVDVAPIVHRLEMILRQSDDSVGMSTKAVGKNPNYPKITGCEMRF
jgi:hypothetical protein